NDTVLGWRLLFDRRVSGSAKLIPLLVIFYILSPIDLLPDVLLPFGVVDDLSAFLLGLQMFIRSAPREVVDEHRGLGPRRQPGGYTPPQNAQIIEGEYEIRDED
ncbi:MAG: DUF1232 domain-containing protein, partial [Chloroflexota bacterium]